MPRSSRVHCPGSWAVICLAGVLPVLFAIGTSITIIEANEIAPQSVLAEVSALWMVAVLVGAFPIVPALVALLIGAALWRPAPVVGRTAVATGLVVMTGVWVLALVAGALYGLGDPPPPTQAVTDGDVLPRLSVAGVAVFATPLALMMAANAYAIAAVFSDRSVAAAL